MDSFTESCDEFPNYPGNLVRHDTLKHNIKAYQDRLQFQSKDLFVSEGRATVEFLDLYEGEQEYVLRLVTCLDKLRCQLREAILPQRSDPRCRFIFLHARHSRDPLRISSDMLKLLFTYHQVMPSFLDFVFPFGKHIYPQDLYFSGLREDTRLKQRYDGTPIESLGRSGRDMRICYNLRSVERLEDPGLPWSIRQSAVYQTLDIETGQAFCIVVKGNKLIKNRITEASKAKPWSSVTSPHDGLSTTLATHLLMCDWAGENWRWYINDLEDRLQALTKGVQAFQVDMHSSPALPAVSSDTFFRSLPSRASTMPPLSPSGTFRFSRNPRVGLNQFSSRTQSETPPAGHSLQAPTLMGTSRVTTGTDGDCISHDPWARTALTGMTNIGAKFAAAYRGIRTWNVREALQRPTKQNQPSYISPDVELRTAATPGEERRMMPEMLPPTHSGEGKVGAEEAFTFSDLQRIQHIEEKAQEALLVLTSNTDVLEELRQYYQHAVGNTDFPSALRDDCQEDLNRFDRCVLVVKKDLQMLQARTQNLLQLTANRKNLLNDMLQFQNSRASERLAKEAALSAKSMQTVTDGMHEIAKRTQRETTSMKIITSVSVTLTLFFLPATFTAVGHCIINARAFETKELQTFMSANILKFENGQQDFQIMGLRLFLIIALPMTVLTFLAWYAIYRWAKKNETAAAKYDEDGVGV